MAAVAAGPRLERGVEDFLAKKKKLLIDGAWVSAANGDTFPVYDPSTGEVLAEVAEGDKLDIDHAVKAARSAFESGPWPKMSGSERARLMWKLADLVEEHLEELAQLESLDNGKPLAVARIADIPLVADHFRYYGGWCTKIGGRTIPFTQPEAGGFFAYTVREPVGVIGQIIPWNFPLLMAAWKLAPALACGCTVVLKPAEQTPLSVLRLGELIMEAGFPKGVVNIVTGLGETAGAALAQHPGVDKIAFTGSTEVGKLIVHAAANDLKKVSLELGGKSPNIVFQDADVAAAAAGASHAIFFNHGQCCCAGSRLYVEKSIFDRVVGDIANDAKNIKLGRGVDADTAMGPLVSQEQLERVTDFLDSGLSDGAEALCGGKRWGTKGYFVEPTVLVKTDPKMKVVREEIFGPVVTAMPFTDIDEIAAEANNTNYGLAAGIWTKDIAKAHRLAAKLRAGTVWVNCYNVFNAALPFGGYKQSGWGREMGEENLELYTETKAVCVQL